MRVSLSCLGHQFPGQPVLFDSLCDEWDAGDVVAITGPSGSGKSTLLSIVAGWLQPTHGEVVVPSEACYAWVFQNPHGVARRRAQDHVVLPLLGRGYRRTAAEAEASAILADFELAELADRPYAALSGGESQRLMLARAIAKSPDIILVDEPTAQLDHASATGVIDVLTSLAGRGAVVVIATHDDRVKESCTRAVDLVTYAEDG